MVKVINPTYSKGSFMYLGIFVEVKSILKQLISERRRVELRFSFYKFCAPLHYGTNRTCNLCNRSYRAFLPFGILEKRSDACCPGCRSLERTRLLGFYLQNEILTKESPIRVLHFAPEPQITQLLSRYSFVNYLSVDINPELAMKQEDIHSLTFKDNSFDLLLNSHVLSVVRDDKKALDEMYRVLAPGGVLILQEWINFDQEFTQKLSPDSSVSDRIKKFRREDLYRDYGTDFFKRTEEAGFEVSYLDYAQNLGLEIKTQYGLNDGQGLILCYKR